MKICFWGNIAGALKGNTDGGGELQLALLAKALARSGNEVIVIDYKTTEDFITVDGIKVFKINGWNKGIRIIRSFTHRLPELYKNLKAQKADIYYCRIRDFRHILAFWAAKKVNARFVLGVASDLDAMNFWMRMKHDYLFSKRGMWAFSSGFLIELIYPYLTRKADLVLVQHEGQKQILIRKNIRSLVFPNLFEDRKIGLCQPLVRKDFIYVGFLDKRKGFITLFEIIKKSPSHNFTIVGPPRDKSGILYYKKLKSFPNVTLKGKLSHPETLCQIADSKALISTSAMEGFPNIFIEAWSYGIPVISLYVDPGGVIEKEKLGHVTYGDLEKLVYTLDHFENSSGLSSRAKAYVEKNHILNARRIKEINSIFEDLLKDKN
jgi:glycosyltransferase involved in cell wall biosynthesis